MGAHGGANLDEAELEAVEPLVEARGEDVGDGGVVDVGEESSGEAFGGVGELGAFAAADAVESGVEVVDAEEDGAREAFVEDEEFGDGRRADDAGVEFW